MNRATAVCFAGMLFCATCPGQPPTQLGVDHKAGLTRINLQGETNRDYTLFGVDLSPGSSNFLATVTLTNSSQNWFDSDSATMPRRFYRALKLPSPTVRKYADDFRLI